MAISEIASLDVVGVGFLLCEEMIFLAVTHNYCFKYTKIAVKSVQTCRFISSMILQLFCSYFKRDLAETSYLCVFSDFYMSSRSPRRIAPRRSVRWEKGPLDLFLSDKPSSASRACLRMHLTANGQSSWGNSYSIVSTSPHLPQCHRSPEMH